MAHPTDAVPRESVVYKQVDGCTISADVFGAQPAARPAERRPAVVWIHGGGLIFGTRRTPRPWLLEALLAAGAVVVSIDHRLAPQARVAQIVDDVVDAWQWLQAEGPERFGIDPARVAVSGGSAGAYLSLLLATRVQPAPRAIASFWGFGDITRPWEAEPSEHYRQGELMSEAKARESVGAAVVADAPDPFARADFYLWCRQQGRWLDEVVGRGLDGDPDWFDPWCPIRRVTPEHPPTFLLHGADDTDVPCDESEHLAARLAEVGVPHELHVVPAAGHGLAGLDNEAAAALEGRAATFLMRHLAA
jgi:acetyl esterase/lipase